MIDTHAHLYLEVFDSDRATVLANAQNAGIEKIIMPGITAKYLPTMLSMQSEYPQLLHLATGIHPCYVHEVVLKDELNYMETALQGNPDAFCAIGEIGIDLHWDQSTLGLQQEVFKQQLILAAQYKLPVILHCRSAFKELLEVLDQINVDITGVCHCFTGTLTEGQAILDRGLKIGIGGVVTFKNNPLKDVLKDIPLKEIILETDAPYLAPTPYRGKRNESSYLTKVVTALSNIYEIAEAEIVQQTNETAYNLFNI